MVWTIEFLKDAAKDFKKLDLSIQRKIDRFLKEKLASCENIHAVSKPLLYNLSGLWRIRMENFRIIFKIQEETKTLKITRIAHRKDAYESI